MFEIFAEDCFLLRSFRKFLPSGFLSLSRLQLVGPKNSAKIPSIFPQDQGRRRKNNININSLVRISCRHFWPLRPDAQGSKSFSPHTGPQENPLFGADVHNFRRGRPWPEGFSKNFLQKKSVLIVWPLQNFPAKKQEKCTDELMQARRENKSFKH